MQAEQNLTTSLGADHPNIASININLGETAWRRGQLSDAESRLRRALSIREAALGLASPAVAEVLRDHAELLQRLGRTENAARLRSRADAIR